MRHHGLRIERALRLHHEELKVCERRIGELWRGRDHFANLLMRAEKERDDLLGRIERALPFLEKWASPIRPGPNHDVHQAVQILKENR